MTDHAIFLKAKRELEDKMPAIKQLFVGSKSTLVKLEKIAEKLAGEQDLPNNLFLLISLSASNYFQRGGGGSRS